MDAMMGYMRAGGIPDRRGSLWPTSDAGRVEAQRRIDEIETYLDTLPHEQFPHLTALRPQLRADTGWANLEFGVDVYIAGLAAYATR